MLGQIWIRGRLPWVTKVEDFCINWIHPVKFYLQKILLSADCLSSAWCCIRKDLNQGVFRVKSPRFTKLGDFCKNWIHPVKFNLHKSLLFADCLSSADRYARTYLTPGFFNIKFNMDPISLDMEQKYILMFEKQNEGEFLANLATFSKTPLINENLVKMKGPCKNWIVLVQPLLIYKSNMYSTNMLHLLYVYSTAPQCTYSRKM